MTDDPKTGGRKSPEGDRPERDDPASHPPREDPIGEGRDEPRKAPGARKPYPVNDPGIADPDRPGAQPDYDPGKALDDLPSM